MSYTTEQLEKLIAEYDSKYDFALIANEVEENYIYLYNNYDNYNFYDEAIEIFDNYFEVAHKDFLAAFANYRGDFISSDREIVAFISALYETGTLNKMGLLEDGEPLIAMRNKGYFQEIAGDKYIQLHLIEEKLRKNSAYLQDNNDKIQSFNWYLKIYNEIEAKGYPELITAFKEYSDRRFITDREKVAFAMAIDNLDYFKKVNIDINKSLDEQLEECKPEKTVSQNFKVKEKSL